MLKRQAVVNAGVTFALPQSDGRQVRDHRIPATKTASLDYVTELAGENPLTSPCSSSQAERRGRDRADKAEYKVKLSCAFCFSNSGVAASSTTTTPRGWSTAAAPDKAVRSAFVSAIDALSQAAITSTTRARARSPYQDIDDCLVLVTNCFSTQTSYENQTKKAITNKFIQEAMTEFLKERTRDLLHREQGRGRQDRRAGAHQQAQPRTGGKGASEYQKEAVRQHRPR